MKGSPDARSVLAVSAIPAVPEWREQGYARLPGNGHGVTDFGIPDEARGMLIDEGDSGGMRCADRRRPIREDSARSQIRSSSRRLARPGR